MLLNIFVLLIIAFASFINCEIVFHDRCFGLDEYRNEINCGFNPDDYLDVPQIIKRHGYPVESHLVETSDGYLLGLHRIPGAKNGAKGRQPVLLQHGILGCSADWILNRNNSLGFTLADTGYDVWLGNARGNTYSKGHISLPNWSTQYWDFSWNEMGNFDLPAVIDYINDITGKQGELIYIGHSLGTTQFFVLSSTLQSVAKNIKLMIALAPTVYMTHLTSPLRYISPFANNIKWIVEHLGVNELLPNSKIFKFLSYECKITAHHNLCQNLLLVLSGADSRELNLDILPTILTNDPAGSSVKTVVYFAQEINNGGEFQNYDYGPKENVIKYGTPTPPPYPLINITTPIYLMYSENDTMTNYIDVIRLSQEIPNVVGLYKVSAEVFSHVDFIFGKQAFQLVYTQILNVLRNFTEYNF